MDLMMILLLALSFIIGGALYNLATAIGEPSIMQIANTYLFFLPAAFGLMLVYMQVYDDKSLEVASPVEYLIVMLVTFLFPFLSMLFQIFAVGKLSFALYVHRVREDITLAVADGGGIVSDIADALGLTPNVLLTIMFNIIIGSAETAVFQGFMPAILRSAFNRYFEEGEALSMGLACFLSSVMFATLHLVYQGWGGFLYAFVSGMMVSLSTQLISLEMGSAFPWSAPCLGHSLYNIAVILLST